MRLLLSAAATALTFLAVPAFAQDIRATGACETTDTLVEALRDAQKVAEPQWIDCDAVVATNDKSVTFSKGGRTLVTFAGHSETEDGVKRLILETVTFTGRAPMRVVRGLCNGGALPSGQVVVVCVASYTDGNETKGAYTVFSGTPEN
jgi:hypothetical protein